MSTNLDDHARLPPRPRPEPDALSSPYWDGLRAHKLMLQRCRACGRVRHYPRPLCDQCYAFEHDWIEARGAGRVHSWTVCHHAFHPAFKQELPYALVTVDLAEGVRLQAPLRGGDPTLLRPELPVLIDFEDVDEALTLPCVRVSA